MAHLLSLQTGRTVTWNALVRECVERHLLGGTAPHPEERAPAATGA
jgi:hypothetical protein